MKSIVLAMCILLATSLAQAQSPASASIDVGIEQDVLPYLTGGYFLGGWIGFEPIRIRMIHAKARIPDVVVPEGFTNNQLRAYALVADYFLDRDWLGWWGGGGIVYWRTSIQSDAQRSTAYLDHYLLNGSFGYAFDLGKRFYVSPWAGMHLRIGGTKSVIVDGAEYTPRVLNPEASVKIGWWF